MKIDYDIAKNKQNITKHKVSFEDVPELDWHSALTLEDNRIDYGEKRYITYAKLNHRLHVLVWTHRQGVVRPISFRKANQRERMMYDQETT